MNENEAKESIKYRIYTAERIAGENGIEDLKMAIQALEDVRQYRALGTPEELRVMKAYSKLSREELFEVVVALMGFQEYRQIGTLKECRTAMEKQTAKRPDYEGDGYADGQLVYDTWFCPCCEKHYEVDYDEYDYCPNCGQHIDWRDGE